MPTELEATDFELNLRRFMSAPQGVPESHASARCLSVALIGPNNETRNAVMDGLRGCNVTEIRELVTYPSGIDESSRRMIRSHDVVIVDLDSDHESALDLVTAIGHQGLAVAMVYSQLGDPNLVVRSMRAGAREFLPLPLTQDAMEEALDRASAIRPVARAQESPNGDLFVFLGGKGGVGVTTLACNFAVSLAEESKKNTLLIDLNLPLGDAAINLGIKAPYSTVDALQNAIRLDGIFLPTCWSAIAHSYPYLPRQLS